MLNKKLVLGILGIAAVALPMTASAAVTGVCSVCHTMHASQDGIAAAAGPQNTLLTATGCIGCHAEASVENTASGKATTGFLAPQVDNATTLTGSVNNAGYFVVSTPAQDGMQHNVAGIAAADTLLATAGSAPGGSMATDDGAGLPTLTCSSCHDGSGGHHSTGAAGFRLLTAAPTTTGPADYGTAGTTFPANRLTNTYVASEMNAVCAACHPDFHGNTNQASTVAGTWVRHPTDIAVAQSALAPSIVATLTPTDSVVVGTGDVIMCLSCHVAHGGPYENLLSFDYATAEAGAGGATNGCETCHDYGSGM